MLNRVPQVVTLKLDRARYTSTTDAEGTTTVVVSNVDQHPFWLRAVWYLLIDSRALPGEGSERDGDPDAVGIPDLQRYWIPADAQEGLNRTVDG